MARQLISSGSAFEQEIGYSRAVVDGEWIFVSGTTGFDYTTMTISESLTEQTDQCLRNIQSALEQAGASLRDVVRVTYVLPRAEDFPKCWPILRQYFGEVRPAAMMIAAGLADPRMRIEIEVTARRDCRMTFHRGGPLLAADPGTDPQRVSVKMANQAESEECLTRTLTDGIPTARQTCTKPGKMPGFASKGNEGVVTSSSRRRHGSSPR